jgi:hypothetical protein
MVVERISPRRQVQLGAGTVDALRRHHAASSSIGLVFTRARRPPAELVDRGQGGMKVRERADVQVSDAQIRRQDPASPAC